MADRATLVWTQDTLTPGVRKAPDDWQNEVGMVMDFFSPRVESHAKTHAPWKDRTGNARNGLTATRESEQRKESIVLSHGMPYGIWLEVRHEGRFAIINPTIEDQGHELMGLISGLFRRA